MRHSSLLPPKLVNDPSLQRLARLRLERLMAVATRGWATVRPAVLALPPILLLLIGLAMFKHVDHDEHQFVASGALLARRGLLPYRDYPYFHLPNLAFVYAALDRLSSDLLLNARLFNCACSALTLSVLFSLAFHWFERLRSGFGTAAGTALVAGVMLNHVFTYTTGKAWNHDLPVLLTLLAVLSLWRWRAAARGGVVAAAWAAACGVLMGLAVGTRLTFAPAAAAFVVCFVGTSRRTGREKAAAVALFFAAGVVAMAPSWALFAVAPRQFLFGNFQYPALNTAFRRAENYPRAMDAAGKVAYLFTDVLVQPGTLALFLAVVASVAGLPRPRGGRPHPGRFEAASLLLVCASLVGAAFAPTPLWLPYFFAPVPFAALFVARVAADERKRPAACTGWWRCLIVGVLAAVPFGVSPYRHVFGIWRTSRWAPRQVHEAGQELRRRCAGVPGPVLTYAPIVALEGGRDIYPEFATGPFAARVAGFLNEDEERLMKEVDDEDLGSLLARRPPAAVMTGFEGELERPLRAYAEGNGYRGASFDAPALGDGDQQVWLPMQAAWRGR